MTRADSEPGGTALVVVDVFDEFTHPSGGRLLADLRARAPDVAAALARARGCGWPVVYVNDAHGEREPEALLRRALAGRGAAVVAPLAPRDGEPVLLKTRYSGFDGTALEETLERAGVRRVAVVGTVAEMCVEATAVDAAARGLETWVVGSAAASLDPRERREAFGNLADRGVRVAVTADGLP